MKIRAQIAMVLNLDKCIGCHTCSVTCKNVWTSRDGVDTPGSTMSRPSRASAIRRIGRTRRSGRAAGSRQANGRLEPRMGGKFRVLAKIFANPDLPEIDDYYDPFTYDYAHLQSAPLSQASPTARPQSVITGKRIEKIEWGPNWEEILGGEFAKRSKDANFEAMEKEIYGQFENSFMMYLPRLCEHCLNPACVAACPSGLDLQARGGRHRPDRPGQVPGLADVRLGLPVQEDLLQLGKRQGGEMHLLLSAHRGWPADGLLGNLRRADPLSRRDAVRRRPDRGSRRQGGRTRSVSGAT